MASAYAELLDDGGESDAKAAKGPPAAVSEARTVVFSAALLTFVAAAFGGYSVLTSAALKAPATLSPVVYAFMRDVIASVVLLTAAYVVERARPDGSGRFVPAKADAFEFIVVGILGVWGAQGLSAMAVAQTTPAFFSFFSPLYPVITLALSLALGMEPFHRSSVLSWVKVAGIVVAAGGAVGLAVACSAAGSSVRNDSKNFGLGMFFIALQVATGGSYAVAQKGILGRYSAVVVTAWGYAAGTFALLLCVLMAAPNASDWALTPLAVGAIAYAGVIASALNYFFMAYVNKAVGPSFSATFQTLTPVFTAALAYVVLGQSFDELGYIGASFIILGLLMAVWSKYAESLSGVSSAGGGRATGGGAAGGDEVGGGFDAEAAGGDNARRRNPDPLAAPLLRLNSWDAERVFDGGRLLRAGGARVADGSSGASGGGAAGGGAAGGGDAKAPLGTGAGAAAAALALKRVTNPLYADAHAQQAGSRSRHGSVATGAGGPRGPSPAVFGGGDAAASHAAARADAGTGQFLGGTAAATAGVAGRTASTASTGGGGGGSRGASFDGAPAGASGGGGGGYDHRRTADLLQFASAAPGGAAAAAAGGSDGGGARALGIGNPAYRNMKAQFAAFTASPESAVGASLTSATRRAGRMTRGAASARGGGAPRSGGGGGGSGRRAAAAGRGGGGDGGDDSDSDSSGGSDADRRRIAAYRERVRAEEAAAAAVAAAAAAGSSGGGGGAHSGPNAPAGPATAYSVPSFRFTSPPPRSGAAAADAGHAVPVPSHRGRYAVVKIVREDGGVATDDAGAGTD